MSKGEEVTLIRLERVPGTGEGKYTFNFSFETYADIDCFAAEDGNREVWTPLAQTQHYIVERLSYGGVVIIANQGAIDDELAVKNQEFLYLAIQRTYPYYQPTVLPGLYDNSSNTLGLDRVVLQTQQLDGRVTSIEEIPNLFLPEGKIGEPHEEGRVVEIRSAGLNVFRGTTILHKIAQGTTEHQSPSYFLYTVSITGATTLGSTLTVSGDTSLQNTTATTITTSSDVKVGGKLNVTGATTLDNTLSVGKKATCKEDLQVQGHASFVTMYSSDTAILHDVTITTALNVGTTAFVGGTLTVSGAVDFRSTLSVTLATLLKGTLIVQGASILKDVTCTTLDATTHVTSPLIKMTNAWEIEGEKIIITQISETIADGYLMKVAKTDDPDVWNAYMSPDIAEGGIIPVVPMTYNVFAKGDGSGSIDNSKLVQIDDVGNEIITTTYRLGGRSIIADLDVVVGRALNLDGSDYVFDLESTYATNLYLKVVDNGGARTLTWAKGDGSGGSDVVINITKNVVPIGNATGDNLVDSNLVYDPIKFLFQAGTSNLNISLASTADVIIARDLLYGNYTWVPKFTRPPTEMIGQFLTLQEHPDEGKFYLSTAPAGGSGSVSVTTNLIPMGNSEGDGLVDSVVIQKLTNDGVMVGTEDVPASMDVYGLLETHGNIIVRNPRYPSARCQWPGVNEDFIINGTVQSNGNFNIYSLVDPYTGIVSEGNLTVDKNISSGHWLYSMGFSASYDLSVFFSNIVCKNNIYVTENLSAGQQITSSAYKLVKPLNEDGSSSGIGSTTQILDGMQTKDWKFLFNLRELEAQELGAQYPVYMTKTKSDTFTLRGNYELRSKVVLRDPIYDYGLASWAGHDTNYGIVGVLSNEKLIVSANVFTNFDTSDIVNISSSARAVEQVSAVDSILTIDTTIAKVFICTYDISIESIILNPVLGVGDSITLVFSPNIEGVDITWPTNWSWSFNTTPDATNFIINSFNTITLRNSNGVLRASRVRGGAKNDIDNTAVIVYGVLGDYAPLNFYSTSGAKLEAVQYGAVQDFLLQDLTFAHGIVAEVAASYIGETFIVSNVLSIDFGGFTQWVVYFIHDEDINSMFFNFDEYVPMDLCSRLEVVRIPGLSTQTQIPLPEGVLTANGGDKGYVNFTTDEQYTMIFYKLGEKIFYCGGH